MEFLRSKPYAATFFGATGGIGTALGGIPRYKFMYYARFVPSSGALALYPDLRNLGNWEDGVSFKIRSIDKPNIELDTQELNQYNRRRYAYTKVSYKPLTVKIYDTNNDIPLWLWRKYFTYYFGDSRPKGSTVGSQTVYNQPPVSANYDYSTGWGLNPVAERLNFFDKIELYAIFGGRYTQINYINPKITDVNWQSYESDSSDLTDFSMSLRYEAVEYAKFGAPITELEARQFGFDIEPALEIPGLDAPSVDIMSWIPRNDIYGLFSTIGSVLSNVLPTDLSRGISTAFQVANASLNLFSAGDAMARSTQSGPVFGTVGGITAGALTATALGQLLTGQYQTNPAQSSFYLGRSAYGTTTLPNRTPGVLGPYGAFQFGDDGSVLGGDESGDFEIKLD